MRYQPPRPARRSRAALTLAAALLAACSAKPDAGREAGHDGSARAVASTGATAAAVAAPGGDSAPMGSGLSTSPATGAAAGMTGMMAPMGGTTGNADRDFLRAMSDHHKGLIAIAHQNIERAGHQVSKPDARALDSAQDRELDQMVTMLEEHFKDPYAPKVMPEHRAMVDSLAALTWTAYDRRFYQDVIRHHEEAVRMVDAYAPKLTEPAVRAMAARMKQVQTDQIAALRTKLAALK